MEHQEGLRLPWCALKAQPEQHTNGQLLPPLHVFLSGHGRLCLSRGSLPEACKTITFLQSAVCPNSGLLHQIAAPPHQSEWRVEHFGVQCCIHADAGIQRASLLAGVLRNQLLAGRSANHQSKCVVVSSEFFFGASKVVAGVCLFDGAGLVAFEARKRRSFLRRDSKKQDTICHTHAIAHNTLSLSTF